MSVKKVKFGDYNGSEVYLYTLTNNSGLSAEILNYGGIIRKLVYKGVDVVLGRDTMEEYIDNDGYFGALIGRNSNRIENAEFELGGKTYKLYVNEGNSNLHGGKEGFDKKVWNAETKDGEEPSLILTYTSPDGEEGFPGEVKVQVTYTLTNDNSIKIHYLGKTDKDTVLNMTNHSYFNLNGHASGKVDGHLLRVDSDFYTPNSAGCMPNGEVLSVKNTPFDFSTEETLGERFKSSHEQMRMFDGIDHNFAIKGRGYRKAASVKGDKSGIIMEVYTDTAGVQVYTTNQLKERKCKEGAVYGKHSAVCLETQAFPNNLSFSHFPDGILRKNEIYDTTTAYKFI